VIIILAVIVLAACLCFISLSLVCIGCTMRCYFKNRKETYQALVEEPDHEELLVEPLTRVDEEADFDGSVPEEAF